MSPLFNPDVPAAATQVDYATASAGDYLIREKLTGDAQYRLIAGLDGSSNPQMALGPGSGAQDIYLRRSAAKTLIFDTDGANGALTTVDFKTTNFYVNGAPITAVATQVSRDSGAAGDYLARAKLTADTQYRLNAGLYASGEPLITFGAGSTTVPDVRLIRTGVGLLQIDNNNTATTVKVALAPPASYGSDLSLYSLNQITYPLITLQTGTSTTPLIALGSGTSAPDVRMQRTGTSQIRYDDNGVGNDLTVNYVATGATKAANVYAIGGASGGSTISVYLGTESYPRVGLNHNSLISFGSGSAAVDTDIVRGGPGNLVFGNNSIAATSVQVDLKPNVAAAGSTLNLFNLTNATAAVSLQTGTGTAPSLSFGPGTGALDWSLTRTAANTVAVGSGHVLDLNAGKLRLPTATGLALTATAGYFGLDSTTGDIEYYDGQRQRSDAVGWAPYATSIGAIFTTAPTTTAVTLAASGGSVAIPVQVTGHMLLQDIRFYIGASTTPTYELQVYRQYLNNGNAGENTLVYVGGAKRASAAGTASAINTATMVGAPVYLPPGLYWVVIRNTTANTIIIGGIATSTWAVSMSQTKTLGSTIVDANLDFVAATWTKVTGFVIPIRFSGRVFGQTAAF